MDWRADIRAIGSLMKREMGILAGDRMYWFMMLVAPVFCFLFFMDLLDEGLPSRLPVAVVDRDNTTTSRSLVRSLNSFAQVEVAMRTADFREAREALQKGEVYGIFYIPPHFRRDASTGEEPTLSFYTNDTYFLAASLLYKDMRLLGSLASGSVRQTLLLAKGEGGPTLTAKLMPIALDTHPLGNPWLSYSIYLANFLLPAFLCMFVMLTTAYSFIQELKRRTAGGWLSEGNGSVIVALTGKYLAQGLVFVVMGTLCLSLLYGYGRFPMNSGFFPMFLAMVLMVAASQGFALFVSGLVSRGRIILSACALWCVLSFSICGFTYPVRSMPWLAEWASNLFLMRHYFLIYIDQALNGIGMAYSWQNYAALLVFALLPLMVLRRLRKNLEGNRYLP